jgi:hypothetical protein
MGLAGLLKAGMAEPTNFSWKEYFYLQWAELLKAVMAECIYLLEEPI